MELRNTSCVYWSLTGRILSFSSSPPSRLLSIIFAFHLNFSLFSHSLFFYFWSSSFIHSPPSMHLGFSLLPLSIHHLWSLQSAAPGWTTPRSSPPDPPCWAAAAKVPAGAASVAETSSWAEAWGTTAATRPSPTPSTTWPSCRRPTSWPWSLRSAATARWRSWVSTQSGHVGRVRVPLGWKKTWSGWITVYSLENLNGTSLNIITSLTVAKENRQIWTKMFR